MAASQTIATISRADLVADQSTPGTSSTITEFKHLSSYNWLSKTEKPTILVPGSPPLWSPPSFPSRLPQDSGLVYIDQNAARSPHSPLEPLFLALYQTQPSFAVDDIDLVSDRNNIRKLLRFVRASSTETFQIRVEIAGAKTALFTRVEERTSEVITDFRGYGRQFEKAYTKKIRGEASESHHRIVEYMFGGMRCVVRSETDAYIDKPNSKGSTGGDDSTNALADQMQKLAVLETADSTTIDESVLARTAVKAGGNTVDTSSTLEIKTRAARRTLDMNDVFPQLWIAQTPNLAVAYHSDGTFGDVKVRDMTSEIGKWEADHQEDLAKLAALLRKIIEAVKAAEGRRATLKYDGGMMLRVVAGDETRALPGGLYTHWKSKPEKPDSRARDSNQTEAEKGRK